MTKTPALLLVLFISQLSNNALAADACVELYRNSLYDEFSDSKNSLSFKATKEAFCRADVTQTDNKQEADTGASYGLISGYGNFSNDEKKLIQSAFCKDDEALSILKNNEKMISRTLNQGAVQAAKDCIDAENRGLQNRVNSPDEDSLKVDLFYSAPPGGAEYQTIQSKNFTSPDLSCKGSLADLSPGKKITQKVISMVCVRTIAQPKHTGQTAEPHFLDNGAYVIIATSAGSVEARLPRKINPRYVAPVAPVTTIEIAGDWNSRGQPTPSLAQIASAGDGNYKFTNKFGSVVSGKRNDENNVEVTGAWGHLTGRLQDKASLLLWSNGTWSVVPTSTVFQASKSSL